MRLLSRAKFQFGSKFSLLLCVALSGLLWQGCSSNGFKQSESNESTETTDTAEVVEGLCPERRLVRQSGKNLFGVIEVGSSGVKGEVIQKLGEPNDEGYTMEPRDEEIEAEDVNAINPQGRAQTVAAIQTMFKEMQARFSIPCEHILIYGSSGFDSKADAAHKSALIAEIEASLGRDFDVITPDQEAIFTFNAVVPEHRLDQVLLLDVGSGNTKGAYFSGDEQTALSIDWGTKSYTTEVDSRRGEDAFADTASLLRTELIVPTIREAVSRSAGVESKSRVYLSGGINWAMATLIQPCQQEQVVEQDQEKVSRFVSLSAADIAAFYQLTHGDDDAIFSPDLSSCSPAQREQAEKDIARIQEKVFTRNELLAGSELLRAVMVELDLAGKDAIFFSRYAFEGLPIGYLKAQLERA